MATTKSNQLKVTLIKSPISSKKNHIATVKALGLRKMHSENTVPNNEAILGMINTVKHLVKVEEV